jgi:hypothetical protein
MGYAVFSSRIRGIFRQELSAFRVKPPFWIFFLGSGLRDHFCSCTAQGAKLHA